VAVVTRHIRSAPAGVFAVLAEGWFYSNWVVGTSHMRAVETGWPAAGTKLHHASGVWPVVIRDETVVEECVPDQLLVLLARARPFGQARVTIDLAGDGSGTTVRMSETPVAGPGKWVNNPVAEALIARRNIEALARLAAIVERHTAPEG
jgi:uncharacterized protein YndB with AHSA1/START domain